MKFKDIFDKIFKGEKNVSEEEKKLFKKITNLMWILALSVIFFVFLLFTSISLGFMGDMPTFEQLENPKTKLAAEIYSSDQKLLGKFYRQNRTTVNFEGISQNVFDALVATEDERFYKHSGIDIIALGRVIMGIVSGNMQGGGSTISQQLAKNLYNRDTTLYKWKIARYASLAGAKFKEWVTAVKLERNYTKEEIMVMYLNTVTFGHGAFGIKSAARTFYNKSPKDLNVQEAAMLVGLLKAPSKYSPKSHPAEAQKRREVVLKQMKKNNYLTQSRYDSIRELPLALKYKTQTHNDGIATYFREFLRVSMQAGIPKRKKYYNYQKYKEDSIRWEEDPMYGWCNKNKKANGEKYDLYKDGLKIYTTIDSKMQLYAEKAVAEHMAGYLQPVFNKYKKKSRKGPFSWKISQKQIDRILYLSMRRSERYRILKNMGYDSAQIANNFRTKTEMQVFKWIDKKKFKKGKAVNYYHEIIDTVMTPLDSIIYYKYFLRTGLMSLNPLNGHVKAYVGGINYRHFKYDHATSGRRQVGSTFKPIIYTLAIINGLSPCTKIFNIKQTFDMPEGQPTYIPQYSTSKYDNEYISLKYGLAFSLNQISAWVLKKYSPKAAVKLAVSMGIKSPIPEVPSICVGSADIYLKEMVGAYTAFANKGFYTKPIYINRIEDNNGNVISTFTPEKKEAISEEIAYIMLEMMRGVVDIGTSKRLRYKYGFRNQIAGKTGTTNDNSDGWFIGIVPNLVTGVWVGGEERTVRFNNTSLGQGANMALPIWAIYMKQIYEDGTLGVSKKDFEKPANLSIEIDCSKYKQETDTEEFYEEDDIFN